MSGAERLVWAVGAFFTVAAVGFAVSSVHAYTRRRRRLRMMLGRTRKGDR